MIQVTVGQEMPLSICAATFISIAHLTRAATTWLQVHEVRRAARQTLASFLYVDNKNA